MSDLIAPLVSLLMNYHMAILVIGLLVGVIVCATQLAQLITLSNGVNNKLASLQTLTDKSGGGVTRIAQLTQRDLETNQKTLQAVMEVSQGLARVQTQAESYAGLLVEIREFYAALKHFQEGMESGSLMAGELGNTLDKFDKAVNSAGQAAGDFTQIMAQVRQDQQAILQSIQSILKTLEQQDEALKKILGKIDLSVKVEIAEEVTATLRKTSEALERNSELIQKLIGTFEKAGKKAKWWGR